MATSIGAVRAEDSPLAAWSRRAASSRSEAGVGLAVYLGLSFLYFGVPIASHPGRDLIANGADATNQVWSLAWWPHAVLHWQNPIYTHAIWAPVGIDLAWAPSIPGLAFLAAPVTLIGGPALAYNVVAIALPALAAWTAYLLCRYLTRSFWPSLVGGYLFGFSAFVLDQMPGHLQMTAVFLIPVVALIVLRFLDGSLSGGRTALLLGLALAVQLTFSLEIELTLTLTLALAFGVAFAVVPTLRPRLLMLLRPLAGGYVIAGLLASPLLVSFLLHFQSGGVASPARSPADLANLVIPTPLTWLSWHWTDAISAHFLGNNFESGSYLGLPTVAIVAWYLWLRRRSAAVRFLAVMLGLGLVIELGTRLHVAGTSYFPLPFAAFASLPVLNDVLPVRYGIFVVLGAAVAVACWAAARDAPRLARVALPALAVIATVPSLWNSNWHERPARPGFFTAGIYRTCLVPNETVLVLPFPFWSGAMLWQAEGGFEFRMADAYISTIPTGLPDRAYLDRLANTNLPGTDWRPLVKLARDQGATMILLAGGHGQHWTTLLAPVTTPANIRGVSLYSLRPNGRSACTAGSP
jgi:hypothetical protein